MNDPRRQERTFDADRAFAREKARLDREEILLYSLSVALFLVALIIYTFPAVKTVHLVYKERGVKNAERALLAEQTRLKLRYEMITSPEEMEKRAQRNGFAALPRDRMVYVDKR
jgi:hypothetical protein